MHLTDFQKKVLDSIRDLPRGKVTTYAEIARKIGRPGSSRAVGNALHINPYAPRIPCHRVVKSDGRIGGFASGSDHKIRLLKNEGISVKNGKIADLKKYLYN